MLKFCFPKMFILKCRVLWQFFRNFIALVIIFFSLFSQAATQEQIETIQKTAEQYVIETIQAPEGARIEVSAAPLDNRIHASDCPTGLDAFSASKNGSASNITVLIRCDAENWRVYVPVKLTAQIPVIVATTPLSRGQIITEQAISQNMISVLRLRQSSFTDIGQLIGAKIKRNVQPGDIIESNDICIVCRNEAVVIKAIKGGMTITTQGVALSDANLGQQLKVKNSKSNRIVDAQATAIGEVTVRF